MFYEHLKGHIEALLFACGDFLAADKLAKLLNIEEEHVEMLIAQLQHDMASEQRGLTIVEVAGGYQICTKPQLYEVVKQLTEVTEIKLSQASMETLAIIAFKQPVTKQEIEMIRGVKIDKLLNNLISHQLIKEIGRKETIGRPIMYGTTVEFLKCFGLNKLDELTTYSQLLSEPQQP